MKEIETMSNHHQMDYMLVIKCLLGPQKQTPPARLKIGQEKKKRYSFHFGS